GDFPFIKSVGPAAGDGMHGAGEAGVPENFASAWAAPVDGQLDPAEGGSQMTGTCLPEMSSQRRNRISLFGEGDGGGENFLQLHRSMAGDHGAPSAARAGHGHIVRVIWIGDG